MVSNKILIAMAAVVAMTAGPYAAAQGFGDGNRYNDDREYQSEISSAEAYQAMMRNEAVILDVRTLREYSAGHPERAYNVPFPNIKVRNDQDPAVFYWEVYRTVKGKLDTPLVTMCRTGSRSIAAANILATGGVMIKDDLRGDYWVQFGEPFTNVRNHWEGFVGQYLYAFTRSGTIALDEGKPTPLDLNNDGVLNVDEADVFSHTNDKNPDKDGWRNFAGLPFSTQIQRPLAYLNDVSLYDQYFAESSTPPQAARPAIGNPRR